MFVSFYTEFTKSIQGRVSSPHDSVRIDEAASVHCLMIRIRFLKATFTRNVCVFKNGVYGNKW